MRNVSNIQEYDHLTRDSFSDEYFFKDVLVNCYEKGKLDENVLSNIHYERMELLKVKLEYYTKDESSSVMVEVAENILQCIDYTIGIYLKTFDNMDMLIDELKHTRLSDILKTGQDLISAQVLECKKLFNKINDDKLRIDNYSYNDTIYYGLKLFFKEYDIFFAAHETSGSIDYQLCIDNIKYTGVEYIYNYLDKLNLENEFCNNFNIDEINKLLKSYDKKCELLLINVFELLLINSLGVIICGRDLNNLSINDTERKYIKNKLKKLSLEKLQEELLQHAKTCCSTLSIKNEALINYIKKSTLKVTSLISQGIELNRLETVFISFDEGNEDEAIEYIDGKKMTNTEFKKLSEEIRDCSLIEDKITLIKNKIKSMEDLVDMLSADCLFGDEYIYYFKSLSQIEIILLSKDIYDLTFEDEYEKEWHYEFKKYMMSLSEEEQIAIRKLRERIHYK
ncbi:hypothetical protein Curi_c27970 [Gottschalkia acidurici 9a]|uniref:Uncharacterized protein n=1 Tax=Gottschalkia acidurici (strain ATCC 7906 / DSM 604 / BCRC 14475 / CIP 104303 / KCTC 5404 / NCIMB 10678 / 9a) TaxID=1128398 RepID=K0B4C9_GOTA9|nr:DUF6179 domain-containing protein [Gottschalkia acidurici]AFS79790.1 hypothetical protein Curi_c27970 [Gottschalkia acidurici 9a]